MKKFFLLVAALFVLFGDAKATTLTGTLNFPNSTGVSGRLLMRLSQVGAASSAGSCGGPFVVVPTTNVIFTIVNGAMPNGAAVEGTDCIAPSGVYYIVTFQDNNGNNLFTTNWQPTGSSVDVGTLANLPTPTGTIVPITCVQIPPLTGAITSTGGCNTSAGSTIPTLVNNNVFTGANTLPITNGVYWVDGTTYTTCAGALAAAGSTGTVLVPPTYAGATCIPSASQTVFNMVAAGNAFNTGGVFTNTANHCAVQGQVNGGTIALFSSSGLGSYTQDGICGSVIVPVGATVSQSDGATGIVENHSSSVYSMGGFFQTHQYAANKATWGINTVGWLFGGANNDTLQNEIDFDVDTGVTGALVYGWTINAPFWNAAPAHAAGISLGLPGGTSGAAWTNFLEMIDGATSVFANIGTNGVGNGHGSAAIQFAGVDSGGTRRTAGISADQNGALFLTPGLGASIDLNGQTTVSNALFTLKGGDANTDNICNAGTGGTSRFCQDFYEENGSLKWGQGMGTDLVWRLVEEVANQNRLVITAGGATQIEAGTGNSIRENDDGVGTGGVAFYGNAFGANLTSNSAACETSFAPTTLATGATTTTTGLSCLPANATIDAVTARVTTTITGSCTGWELGDGTTAARFSSNNTGLTAGTVTDAAHIGTFNNTGIASATTGIWQAAAHAVVITCAGGNASAGAIRIIVFYHTWTAPTS